MEQIEQIRKSLSPTNRTNIDALGTFLPHDATTEAAAFPSIYWNNASALYVYTWGNLSRQGIDVITHDQLAG